jgi:hypothetical protein|tara:strand:+ start:1615 stop:2997 length:1383 start_codon:yes stop_codon:yes gene_type:complete
MQLQLIKFSSLFLLLFSVNVFATDTALIIHSNYSDAHTNVKAQLEEDGYTVTLSTSGSVPENLINNYDVVFDLKYNNSIGSNGRTRYAAFVNAGGILTLVGENHVNHSNNNNTIGAFINNTLSASITIVGTTGGGNCGNDCNMTQTNTSAGVSSYSDVGVYPYGAYFTGDGTWVVKSTSGKILWMKWSGDQLPSGYSGEVYVTFDINQFTSSYDSASTDEFIGELYTSSTPQSAISSSQTTIVNTTRAKTGNGVYITQSGGSLDLDIVQDGDNNLIIGTDLTSNASIVGDNNTLSITQNNDNNVLGIDINGNSNNLTIIQDKDQRALVNVVGASNTLTLDQLHLLNVGDHFTSLNIAGSSNTLNLDQKESGDKIMFLDIDSSNNVTVLQEGTGDHFLDLNITNNHTVNVTQDGTGDHSATIGLTGNTSTLNLTQDSSTDQNYHLQQNCVASSCSATVTQN